MKDYRRFAHAGVLEDLDELIDRLRARRYEVGSSGDGEITFRGPTLTAYVRRYRQTDEWRVYICARTPVIEEARFRAIDEVERFVVSRLS